MNKRLVDVVIVPAVLGFIFMVYGAWYSGVRLHSPVPQHWLKATLFAPVQLWIVLLLIGTIAGLVKYAQNSAKKLRNCIQVKSDLNATLNPNRRAHDERLFRQADQLLSEQSLADILSTLQNDHSWISSQRFKLDSFAHFFFTTGNHFIDPIMLARVEEVRRAITKLLAFTGQNFFTYPRDAMNVDLQSCLQPWLNVDREGDASTEQHDKYREFSSELDTLVNDVRRRYREYRLAAKNYLQI